MVNNPLVSIVTVCYNAVETIEKTILSVINQTYSNIEYIIIDGGSTDGTNDIIAKYHSKISYWVSEKDRGIYDAMNKSINVANGKWINFMNAGDTYYQETTIEQFIMQISPSTDIAYGDTMIILAIGKFLEKAKPLNFITRQMAFGHQAAFVRVELHKKSRFDISFRSSGDYNFFYHVYMQKYNFEYIPIIVANYDGESGVSNDNYVLARWEDGIIQGKTRSFVWKMFFVLKMSYYLVKQFLKRFTPLPVVNFMRERNLKKSGLIKCWDYENTY